MNRKCPICGGEFEGGFVGYNNNIFKQVWSTGVKVIGPNENVHEVKVYRCKNCGYLESYAK